MGSEEKYLQKRTGVKMILDLLDVIAKKNANSACRGFMYEPKVPKKLKK